jgi:hypothetical protein
VFSWLLSEVVRFIKGNIDGILRLIVNARLEMLAALECGDDDCASLWGEAMDKFLDAYAREKRESGGAG